MHQDVIWSVASSAGTGSAVATFARLTRRSLSSQPKRRCWSSDYSLSLSAAVCETFTLCRFRVRCRPKNTLQSLLWFAVVRQLLPSTNTHTHADTHQHTHTHSLETGCFQAYARIDGAFVCSVQSWRFEASLCLLFKAASQQHTTWCNMMSAYKIYDDLIISRHHVTPISIYI